MPQQLNTIQEGLYKANSKNFGTLENLEDMEMEREELRLKPIQEGLNTKFKPPIMPQGDSYLICRRILTKNWLSLSTF
jgi:hypothetical protein